MHPCERFDILEGQDSSSVIVDIVTGCTDQNCAMLRHYMDMKTGKYRAFTAPKRVQYVAKYMKIIQTVVLICRK